MKKIVFIAISFLITFFAFSQTVSEVEPNGCITLVGGMILIKPYIPL
jgi:hypothetical protein